jgi:hypothetical protein
MARKKKFPRSPRRKRMTRQSRLISAKATSWVKQYAGENIIRGYAKWFGVDGLCAVVELRMLGVSITAEREAQIEASIEARAVQRRRKEKPAAERGLEGLYSDSFAYTAGYTSGGAPYGVTWEELEDEE